MTTDANRKVIVGKEPSLTVTDWLKNLELRNQRIAELEAERDSLHQSLNQLVSAFRHWQYRCPGRVLTWPAEVDELWAKLTDSVMEADALLKLSHLSGKPELLDKLQQRLESEDLED